MMNGQRISLVERYLNGRMSPAEARDFQLRLEADPKLRQLLRDEQQIEQALRRDSEAIPKLGSQRLEQFVKASAGKGPSGPGNSATLGGAGAAQRGMKEILLQFITGRGFLVMAAVAGTVVVATVLMWEDDTVPVPLPAVAANMAQPAPAHNAGQRHDAVQPHDAAQADDAGEPDDAGRQMAAAVDDNRSARPAAAPVPDPVGSRAARESLRTEVRRERISSPPVEEQSASATAPPDSAAAPKLIKQVIVDPSKIAKPNALLRNRLKAASSRKDSLEAIREFMEREGNGQPLDVESNDSLRTKVKVN